MDYPYAMFCPDCGEVTAQATTQDGFVVAIAKHQESHTKEERN